jgi:hypothetical protein
MKNKHFQLLLLLFFFTGLDARVKDICVRIFLDPNPQSEPDVVFTMK